MKAKYTRLYADAQGESHFEDLEVPLNSVPFAPLTPPLDLSAFLPATQCAFLGGVAGWRGDWHPSSARNFFVVLTGEWEIEASDGSDFCQRRLLAEDTRKGHRRCLLEAPSSGKGHSLASSGRTLTISALPWLGPASRLNPSSTFFCPCQISCMNLNCRISTSPLNLRAKTVNILADGN